MVKLEKNEEQLKDSIMGKISLEKDKVNLEKHVVSLSKCVVNLSKKADFDLGNIKARVVFALDDSGSMEDLFRNGAIQDLLNRLVPLGLTFDDNGSIEVYRFSSRCAKLPDVNLSNYETYVRRVMIPKAEFAGTKYAPVLKKIFFEPDEEAAPVSTGKSGQGFLSKLFGKNKQSNPEPVNMSSVQPQQDKDMPTFVFFATDGDNSDRFETEDVIKAISRENGFVQFVGMGTASFNFLRRLDDLPGRQYDNTGFTKVTDMEGLDDSGLYTILLEQFIDWLKKTRS
jgi:hypothetical protein